MSDINNDKIIPPSDIPAQRVMMMPKDANPNGKIFGGILLSLIDVAGVIEAVRQAPNTYVTGTMREVCHQADFLNLEFWELLERYDQSWQNHRHALIF